MKKIKIKWKLNVEKFIAVALLPYITKVIKKKKLFAKIPLTSKIDQ